jgi:hypothetical protein
VAAVERRRIAWLLSFTLMAAGAVTAHALAYRLVAPAHHMDSSMHAETNHGYISHLDACLAICGAIAILALVASLVSRLRRGHLPRAPLWLFAVVPPAGFAVQEHLEHVLATGALPATAALDGAFIVGVVLQLPFAIAAYLAARALLALASALVDSLRAPTRARLLALAVLPPGAAPAARPRRSALALGYGQRAPPLGAV